MLLHGPIVAGHNTLTEAKVKPLSVAGDVASVV